MNTIEAKTFATRMAGNFPTMTDEQLVELATRLERERWTIADADAAIAGYIGTEKSYTYAGFSACRPGRRDAVYEWSQAYLAELRQCSIELTAEEEAADAMIAGMSDADLGAAKECVVGALADDDLRRFYSARNPRICRWIKMAIWEGQHNQNGKEE